MKNIAVFAFFLAVVSATSWQCFFCAEVVQIVENYIQGGGIKNETEVLDVLEGLCQYLGNYQQECVTLVKDYGPLIIAELEHGVPAQDVCEQVKLCNETSNGVNLFSPLSIDGDFSNCRACNLIRIITRRQSQISITNVDVKHITELFLQLCNYYSVQCNNFISNVQSIIEETMLENSSACKTLELC